MPSRAGLVLAGVVATGVIALAIVMAADKRGFAAALNTKTAVRVPPGKEVCRRSVKPKEAGVNALRFHVDTAGRPGPPLELRVFRGYTRPTVVATGSLSGGYRTGEQEAALSGSAAGAFALSACVDNVGSTPITITPPPPLRARERVQARGRTGFQEISVTLVRKPSRSLLSLMPTAFERATLFRPGWVGAWTYWLLAVSVIFVVPFMLTRALAALEDED